VVKGNSEVVGELDVSARLGHDARWTNEQNVVSKVVAEQVGGTVLTQDAGVADVALGRHKTCTALGSLLYEGSVGHDVARGTIEEDGDARLGELDGGTIVGDHTRGTNQGSLSAVVKGNSEVVGELDVSARLGHDARWTNEQNVVSKVVAEQVGGTVLTQDAGVADVALGRHKTCTALLAGKVEVVGELNVTAVLGDDARWTNHRNVIGQSMAELEVVAVGTDDAGGTDNTTLGDHLGNGHGAGSHVQFCLSMSKLTVGAGPGHDARRSHQHDVVGEVV